MALCSFFSLEPRSLFKAISLIVCTLFLCVSLAQFACLPWSPCEKKLLYVAEKKRVEPSAHSSVATANEDGGLVMLEEQVKCLLPYIVSYSNRYG